MSQLLKLCETRKLHYGKYLYKLVLTNSLNVLFRTEFQKDGKLGYTRHHLDIFSTQLRDGVPLTQSIFRTIREIEVDEFLDAKDIYSILKKSDDYKIRVERSNLLSIYSNDRAMLTKIANRMRKSSTEFWEPNVEALELLTSNRNVIIVDNPPEFPLKVIFKGRANKDFANWLRANRDKSRIGDRALQSLEKSGWIDGYYMYVRDEKVLSLVTLLIGSNIRCVESLVYKGNIDKYMYGSK